MDIDVLDASRLRTVVFCTAFVYRDTDPYYSWSVRYRIWLEAVRRSKLKFDQLVLVDDGSATLPDWQDIRILQEGDDLSCEEPAVLYHFRNRLGRNAISDFPGWVRSFFFMSRYAEANGFDKIVHLEADAFLISDRAVDTINRCTDGWGAMWCPRFNRPESGIQVIAGSGLALYGSWAKKPIERFSGRVIEETLPFTFIERGVEGDRYGEREVNRVPRWVDWCMQAVPPVASDYGSYFWWMPWFEDVFPHLKRERTQLQPMELGQDLVHKGLYYLDWLKEVDRVLQPRTYLEVGTHAGDSLKSISCDAVCIDPQFVIDSNVLNSRKSAYFYQGTSDDFFAEPGLAERVLPTKVDLAFLDGLHLYEALLQDFVNTEAYMNQDGMILMHDCLPLNTRMAERQRRNGLDDEPEGIREFWTGDVWKVVAILDKYRPDLKMTFIDCGPTGLVAVTGFDPNVTRPPFAVLAPVVREYEPLTLQDFGIRNLWGLKPRYSADRLASDDAAFFETLFPARD